jgi:hypothetical protein
MKYILEESFGQAEHMIVRTDRFVPNLSNLSTQGLWQIVMSINGRCLALQGRLLF